MRLETECIDRLSGCTSIGLHRSCHEALWEEERGNPESGGWSINDPIGDEINTVDEIFNPGAERLE